MSLMFIIIRSGVHLLLTSGPHAISARGEERLSRLTTYIRLRNAVCRRHQPKNDGAILIAEIKHTSAQFVASEFHGSARSLCGLCD